MSYSSLCCCHSSPFIFIPHLLLFLYVWHLKSLLCTCFFLSTKFLEDSSLFVAQLFFFFNGCVAVDLNFDCTDSSGELKVNVGAQAPGVREGLALSCWTTFPR